LESLSSEQMSQIILLVILIVLSGFFSASETALTAFKATNLGDFEGKHEKIAKRLKKWLKDPNEMLTAILIGNNIVNILASSIATVTVSSIVKSGNAVAIATGIMTLVVLIFGEITPKVIAKNNPKQVSAFVITVIYYMSIILKPFIWILIAITKFIGRVLGIDIKDENLMFTTEEFKAYVEVGEAEGSIDEEEREMIHSIMDLGETSAKEVMTPRTSILMLAQDQTVEDVWDEVVESGYSRIPIYGESIDHIEGVLYAKDLLAIAREDSLDKPLSELIREAYFVPETKPIIDILEDFREKHVHMALAVDEYGGIVGLVTIEDLIEEIVGEIQDEYDQEEEEEIKKLDINTYKVDAMINLEDLNEDLEIKLPISEDYESLGGYINDELGRLAEVGDEINVEDVNIKVVSMDNRRVEKVVLKIDGKEEEEEEKEE